MRPLLRLLLRQVSPFFVHSWYPPSASYHTFTHLTHSSPSLSPPLHGHERQSRITSDMSLRMGVGSLASAVDRFSNIRGRDLAVGVGGRRSTKKSKEKRSSRSDFLRTQQQQQHTTPTTAHPHLTPHPHHTNHQPKAPHSALPSDANHLPPLHSYPTKLETEWFNCGVVWRGVCVRRGLC
jgi:hypothetical protein